MSDSRVEPFEVLTDTERYLIVHKSPGISFHNEGNQSGLVSALRKKQASQGHSSALKLFTVHRLDKVCSGILVFARGRKNADAIGNVFRHRRAQKIYLALSDRRPKKERGRISGGMIRGRRGSWRLTSNGQNLARTSFFSIPIFHRRPGLRLYILLPQTGRTHQLRVAMKSLGVPILGDGLYGRFDLARQEDRTYLHAYALRFQLGDEEVCIVDHPPRPGIEFSSGPFLEALAALGNIFEAVKKHCPDPDRHELRARLLK